MIEVLPHQTVVVWFSNGVASAVAAHLTLKRYRHRANVRVLNNPVTEEHPDNRRFMAEVQTWIDHPIEYVPSARYPIPSAVDVWEDSKAMSFPTGAPCTRELKKRARQEWESRNSVDWHVFGFTKDEEKRHTSFVMTERSNVIPVLIDECITKQGCMDIILEAGIEVPAMYRLGFPNNNNCMGCVKATSPTYWNHVREHQPDVFKHRAEQSRRLGVKLVRYRGERIYLDELPPDARGRPLASLDVGCGIICEEGPPETWRGSS